MLIAFAVLALYATTRVMQRTKVKICGITCAEDAMVASEAGADAIGLIFHPPAFRGISILAAEQILASIPPFLTPVGLFLDSPVDNIASLAGRLGLRCLQLHGHETVDDVRALARFEIIKAVHVKPNRLAESLAPWREAVASGLKNLRALVLETGWGAAQGGTGVENDWQQILEVKQQGLLDGLPPIILAGGLRPKTVGNVIQMLQPYAVDVSSGVEETKGRKSRDLVHAFIREARCADHNRRHAVD